MSGTRLAYEIAPVGLLGLAGLLALPFIKTSGDTPVELIQAFKPWIGIAASIAVVAAAYAAWTSRRGDVARAVAISGLAGLFVTQLVITGHEALSPSTSAYATAQQVKPYLRPGVAFYSVGGYEQTLNFYLGRTVTLVQFRDELDYGLQQEPQLEIPTIAQWVEIWKRQPYALAYVDEGIYEQLLADGFPIRLIASDQHRYFIKTP